MLEVNTSYIYWDPKGYGAFESVNVTYVKDGKGNSGELCASLAAEFGKVLVRRGALARFALGAQISKYLELGLTSNPITYSSVDYTC